MLLMSTRDACTSCARAVAEKGRDGGVRIRALHARVAATRQFEVAGNATYAIDLLLRND